MVQDQTAPLEQSDLGPLCLLRDFCHNVEGRYDKSCIVSCIVYGVVIKVPSYLLIRG